MQSSQPKAAFWPAFWALAKPYWVSGARRKGVILLCSVVGFTLALVWVEVQFNDWNKGFYDTFEHKDRLGFYLELGRFAFLAVLFIVLAVYKQYLQQMLMIEWRAWLTDTYLQDWLDGQAYYRLQLLDRGTDNPDQRIADDLNGFVDLTLSLSLGLLSAIVTLVSFVGILWVISGPLEVGGVTIPGYMVWVALLYAIAGTWLTHLIGQPLIGMNFARQRVEADFRFALVRLRENSEGVALYRGEAGELAGFKARFADVIAKWWAIMEKQKQVTWFTAFYAQLAIIFPFVVSAPRYFSGAAPLGSIFQTASAFGQVQGALSWFIGAYPSFANWRATVERLTGFTQALARARAEADRLDGERLEGEDAGLTLEHLVISLPQGSPLLGDTSLRLAPGESVFVTGPSGSGKSTLFRSIAGIWPYWQGRILLPKGARLLFLPQKAYLPIGTLKNAIAYPAQADAVSDADVTEALVAVGLGALQGDLARDENWGQVLSGGEQQRVAFARALINRPEWLFLDEASAALPEQAQAEMYSLMRERLPQTTLVSIGHRESLAQFHQRRLRWQVTPGEAPGLSLS
ncbi:MAG: ABC transporter ATP-binding protein/permease [Burkholderiales bacterium]